MIVVYWRQRISYPLLLKFCNPLLAIDKIADCKTLVKGNAAFLKESLVKNFKKIFGWIW